MSQTTNLRPRRGATLVETALGLLLFLMLLVGLIELGRGVWTYTTLAHATRQGARFAMARGTLNPATADQVREAVRTSAVGLDRTLLTVTTTWESGLTRGGFVRVQVRYPFALVSGGLILSQSRLTLGASSRVVVAN